MSCVLQQSHLNDNKACRESLGAASLLHVLQSFHSDHEVMHHEGRNPSPVTTEGSLHAPP